MKKIIFIPLIIIMSIIQYFGINKLIDHSYFMMKSMLDVELAIFHEVESNPHYSDKTKNKIMKSKKKLIDSLKEIQGDKPRYRSLTNPMEFFSFWWGYIKLDENYWYSKTSCKPKEMTKSKYLYNPKYMSGDKIFIREHKKIDEKDDFKTETIIKNNKQDLFYLRYTKKDNAKKSKVGFVFPYNDNLLVFRTSPRKTDFALIPFSDQGFKKIRNLEFTPYNFVADLLIIGFHFWSFDILNSGLEITSPLYSKPKDFRNSIVCKSKEDNAQCSINKYRGPNPVVSDNDFLNLNIKRYKENNNFSEELKINLVETCKALMDPKVLSIVAEAFTRFSNECDLEINFKAPKLESIRPVCKETLTLWDK